VFDRADSVEPSTMAIGRENRLDHLSIPVPGALLSIPDRAAGRGGHVSRLSRFSKRGVDANGQNGDGGRTFE
jgi:hypothetical protein